jgi:hypothetical protein
LYVLSGENFGGLQVAANLQLFYFDLPPFLAQASLQYFDLALNVV